jgi:magnesium-transporting ATPase (P-type)
MLTGDKKSTALTIGENTNLLTFASAHERVERLIHLEGRSAPEVLQSLTEGKIKAAQAGGPYSLVVEGGGGDSPLQVLVKQHSSEFESLAVGASCVICCRVTPQQKADVVALIKNTDNMTLVWPRR